MLDHAYLTLSAGFSKMDSQVSGLQGNSTGEQTAQKHPQKRVLYPTGFKGEKYDFINLF